MKVYIVTSGEYSDYCINRVFTDETQARLYCAVCNNQDAYPEYAYPEYVVEEYETDDIKIDGTLYYGIIYNPSVNKGYSEYASCFYSNKPIKPNEVKLTSGVTRIVRPVNKYYKGDELLKICYDLYAQFVAESEEIV